MDRGNTWKGIPKRVIVPYPKSIQLFIVTPEYLRTWIAWGNLPVLTGKAKYFSRPIVNQYREGKVKRTPEGEWNRPETVCLQVVEEVLAPRRRAYWRMSQRVYLCCRLRRYALESQGNRVWIGRNICSKDKTRNKVSLPWAGWSPPTSGWRPEPLRRSTRSDDLW